LKQLRVGFQGEHGAYSEQAIVNKFGGETKTIPCKSIRDVFNLAEVGSVEFAVVPIENSIEGSVGETYDLLLTSSVKVVGEIVLRVIHCLIGLPSARLEQIRFVYSHPQALSQCRGFVASLRAEPMITYDTAGSVKIIKDQGDNAAAAIASEKAAALYEMKILARGIEDYGRNYTRFLVISKTDTRRTKESKTSIIFSVPHTPGSLYGALEAFAKEEINLTKIESRPTRQRPWEYYFYLDFDGHIQDKKCARVLAELTKHSVFLKVLGSYPRSRVELN